MVKKLGTQGFPYHVNELFEPITKTLTDTNQKQPEETRFNTRALEDLDGSNKYVETLESMKKSEVIHSSLIRPIAKFLVAKNKSQFRLLDDPDDDNWKNSTMHREKTTIYDDKLLFEDTGVVLTLKKKIFSQ